MRGKPKFLQILIAKFILSLYTFFQPMTSDRKQPRSAITKDSAKQVIVYFPPEVIQRLDAMARDRDTDRSKLIRKAVSAFMAHPA
jgi:hypothetical protein